MVTTEAKDKMSWCSHLKLYSVVSTHFLLTPKSHSGFELKIVRFDELEFDSQPLFRGQLVELLRSSHSKRPWLQRFAFRRFLHFSFSQSLGRCILFGSFERASHSCVGLGTYFQPNSLSSRNPIHLKDNEFDEEY